MDGWYECCYDTYNLVDYNITFLRNFQFNAKKIWDFGQKPTKCWSQSRVGQVIRLRTAGQYLQ